MCEEPHQSQVSECGNLSWAPGAAGRITAEIAERRAERAEGMKEAAFAGGTTPSSAISARLSAISAVTLPPVTARQRKEDV